MIVHGVVVEISRCALFVLACLCICLFLCAHCALAFSWRLCALGMSTIMVITILVVIIIIIRLLLLLLGILVEIRFVASVRQCDYRNIGSVGNGLWTSWKKKRGQEKYGLSELRVTKQQMTQL